MTLSCCNYQRHWLATLLNRLAFGLGIEDGTDWESLFSDGNEKLCGTEWNVHRLFGSMSGVVSGSDAWNDYVVCVHAIRLDYCVCV